MIVATVFVTTKNNLITLRTRINVVYYFLKLRRNIYETFFDIDMRIYTCIVWY